MREPFVFVLNKTDRYDFGKAEDFGTIMYVTEGIVSIFKPDIMTKQVHKALQDFREEDYLLISGPAILSMITITYLFDRYDTIQTLVHDARLDKYIVRNLSKDRILGGI
jgi:hypothetical protein